MAEAYDKQPWPRREQTDGYTSAPGETGIAVEHLSGLSGAEVRVNGRLIQELDKGMNFIPLPPGEHYVGVTGLGFRVSNHSVVPVTEGRTTYVYYRSPLIRDTSGMLGPQPRMHAGAVLAYALWTLLGVWIVAFLVFAYSR
ncbi:hypothetical protein [Nocardia callitridis]|uniref:PEGA domain-containing protein n=1 Tax=Nocardia callitridis TaxID=648753 RepID=A0ABP9JRX5_9NOCA